MSQPSSHISPVPAHDGDDDGVNLKLIVMVGVVSLVVFVASAIIAWLVLRGDRATYSARGIAPDVHDLAKKEEIGIIDYVPFDGDHRLERWQQQKAKELSSYGWVDRKKGLIHIPIDEAIKEVVRQAAAGAGGAPR
jgi:hypothetical protein